jgi:hypothetical protein
MYAMSLAAVSIWATRIRVAFIYHSTDGADGIFAYFLTAPHHLSLVLGRDVMAVLMTFFADFILVSNILLLCLHETDVVCRPGESTQSGDLTGKWHYFLLP